jgi:DNA-binding IclR family transcriptional regulator
LLAHMSEDMIETCLNGQSLQSFTPYTITDQKKLRLQLALIRQQGYAIDNEERELGMRGVAAPIMDYEGKMVAAIAGVGASNRLSPDKDPEVIRSVQHSAIQISRALGYKKM